MAIATFQITRVMAVFFGGVGAYCLATGFDLKYYGLLGPGPGFFPVWIGVLLLALSGLLLVRGFRPGPAADEAVPFNASTTDAARVGAFVTSFVVVWLLLDYLGFRLAIFVFAVFASRIIEPQPPLRTLGLALVCSLGVAYGFENWLKVQLPSPSIGFLADLGF